MYISITGARKVLNFFYDGKLKENIISIHRQSVYSSSFFIIAPSCLQELEHIAVYTDIHDDVHVVC